MMSQVCDLSPSELGVRQNIIVWLIMSSKPEQKTNKKAGILSKQDSIFSWLCVDFKYFSCSHAKYDLSKMHTRSKKQVWFQKTNELTAFSILRETVTNLCLLLASFLVINRLLMCLTTEPLAFNIARQN